jgi:hypothetical protein
MAAEGQVIIDGLLDRLMAGAPVLTTGMTPPHLITRTHRPGDVVQYDATAVAEPEPGVFTITARPRLRKIHVHKAQGAHGGLWVWSCTLCHPEVQGATVSWRRTVANARRHLCRRYFHHCWTVRTLGRAL